MIDDGDDVDDDKRIHEEHVDLYEYDSDEVVLMMKIMIIH